MISPAWVVKFVSVALSLLVLRDSVAKRAPGANQ